MYSQEVIDDFFKKKVTSNEFGARSVLHALINDLNFCVGGIRYKKTNPNPDWNEFYKVMPTLACISIYCTAIDLLARVSKRRAPNPKENGKFFKYSAVKWFNHTRTDATHLWDLRNTISHHYKLTNKDVINPYGGPTILKKDGLWYVNLTALYGNLDKASNNLYEKISNQSAVTKAKTAKYIDENCFFFVLKN